MRLDDDMRRVVQDRGLASSHGVPRRTANLSPKAHDRVGRRAPRVLHLHSPHRGNLRPTRRSRSTSSSDRAQGYRFKGHGEC